MRPVASLGWVSPGAATEVSPHFFRKGKLATFFSHHRLVRPRLSTILSKFARKFFPSGVNPWRMTCHPGGPPPSNATECVEDFKVCYEIDN